MFCFLECAILQVSPVCFLFSVAFSHSASSRKFSNVGFVVASSSLSPRVTILFFSSPLLAFWHIYYFLIFFSSGLRFFWHFCSSLFSISFTFSCNTSPRFSPLFLWPLCFLIVFLSQFFVFSSFFVVPTLQRFFP